MTFARDSYLVLQGHDWPGNVRELRNLVERVAILRDGPELGPDDVAGVLPGSRKPRVDRFREGTSFHDLAEDAEREIITAALARNGENVSETARALGLERSHLYKKMKGLGMKR
jgi:DNA-binding NtrC family response regulator